MSDLREQIRDEIAGRPVGNGYYGSTISVEEAAEIADAVLKVLADPPDDVIERAAEAIDRACFGQELPEAPIDLARAALAALVRGEQK